MEDVTCNRRAAQGEDFPVFPPLENSTSPKPDHRNHNKKLTTHPKCDPSKGSRNTLKV